MTIQGKINKETLEIFKQENKIGILASLEEAAGPHLEIEPALRCFSDSRIIIRRFNDLGNRQFFELNPVTAFLVLSSDMRWFRGSMHFTQYEDTGGNIRNYYFDLISVEEIRKLPIQKIYLGMALSRLKAKTMRSGAHSMLTCQDMAMFSGFDAVKFLCWEENRNLSDIVPIIQAVPAGADRIVFSGIPYGEDTADLDIGVKAAIICINPVFEKSRAVQAIDFQRRRAENAMRSRPLFEPVGRVWPRSAAHSQPGADPSLAQAENSWVNTDMRSVLVKGRFTSKGVLSIEWVYNNALAGIGENI